MCRHQEKPRITWIRTVTRRTGNPVRISSSTGTKKNISRRLPGTRQTHNSSQRTSDSMNVISASDRRVTQKGCAGPNRGNISYNRSFWHGYCIYHNDIQNCCRGVKSWYSAGEIFFKMYPTKKGAPTRNFAQVESFCNFFYLTTGLARYLLYMG